MPRQPSQTVTLARYWGTRVRKARTEAGRTQELLAALAGVTQQTISQVESGVIAPSDNLKLRIARSLGMAPGDLFDWPDDVEAA